VLLEASDGVGGRVRTDTVDGFTLDRGFAIFLTSYPETKVPSVICPRYVAIPSSDFRSWRADQLLTQWPALVSQAPSVPLCITDTQIRSFH